jgi:hypothetical protein
MWQHLVIMDDVVWVSCREASRLTDYSAEAIRQWSLGDQPQIRRRVTQLGRRVYVHVALDDVRRRAEIRPRHRPGPAAAMLAVDTASTDRETVLEELVVRRQIIDEHREQIEDLHKAIIREQREIERLLLGPSRVPTN